MYADSGLKCIYALGGGDILLLNNYQELVDHGITPEQEILTRHFCYFGPVPEGLFDVIENKNWTAALRGAAAIADDTVKDEPELKFAHWGGELGAQAVDMLLGMTALDPKARLGIEQVLAHPYWEEDG